MTKSELINLIAERKGIHYRQAEQIVSTIFDSMSQALESGNKIEIRGFGSFSLREYGSRTGRNPKNGELVCLKPRKAPFFKVGKELRERVNGLAVTT